MRRGGMPGRYRGWQTKRGITFGYRFGIISLTIMYGAVDDLGSFVQVILLQCRKHFENPRYPKHPDLPVFAGSGYKVLV